MSEVWSVSSLLVDLVSTLSLKEDWENMWHLPRGQAEGGLEGVGIGGMFVRGAPVRGLPQICLLFQSILGSPAPRIQVTVTRGDRCLRTEMLRDRQSLPQLPLNRLSAPSLWMQRHRSSHLNHHHHHRPHYVMSWHQHLHHHNLPRPFHLWPALLYHPYCHQQVKCLTYLTKTFVTVPWVPWLDHHHHHHLRQGMVKGSGDCHNGWMRIGIGWYILRDWQTEWFNCCSDDDIER